MKAFFDNLEANVQNIPILGPLLLQLTNQAIWIMLLGGVPSYLFLQSEDYALLGWLLFLTTATFAGMRQWRDMRVAIESNRPQLEGILTDTLHAAKIGIPYKGRIITLDIPDSLEPGISRAVFDAVLSVIPNDPT